MWMQIGAAAGALVLVVTLLRRLFRRRSRRIEVGPVSDTWLAEQRARRQDSM